jgi:hypothetical protein
MHGMTGAESVQSKEIRLWLVLTAKLIRILSFDYVVISFLYGKR